MKENVEVTFSCGHEGEIETETTLSMTQPEVSSTIPVDKEIVQYMVFRNSVKCPECETSFWKEN